MRLQKALRKGRTPYRLAIEHLENLCLRNPNFAEYHSELALAHYNLGNLLQDDKQFSEAVAEYQLAESTYQRLIAGSSQGPPIPPGIGQRL